MKLNKALLMVGISLMPLILNSCGNYKVLVTSEDDKKRKR